MPANSKRRWERRSSGTERDKIGASEGIRTLDIHVGNVTLYQTELRSLPDRLRQFRGRRLDCKCCLAFFPSHQHMVHADYGPERLKLFSSMHVVGVPPFLTYLAGLPPRHFPC